jgi:hypothetical protein
MRALERMMAALSGELLEERPSMVWSSSPGHRADVVTTASVELRHALKTHPDQLVLVEVHSPLGLAIRRDIDLVSMLQNDLEFGAAKLEELKTEVSWAIVSALEEGAHGVFYRLDGAHPRVCTPMQYGGHFLEIDRELLSLATEANFNLVYIEGEGEVYFDFVADLPCHAFSWSNAHNDINIHVAKTMTSARIALDHEEADIFFARSYDEIERLLSRTKT